MAVVAKYSNLLTNTYAAQATFNPDYLDKTRPVLQVATVNMGAADSNNSTYRMTRVYSGDLITSIRYWCDALGGSAAYSFGLYETVPNGGGVAQATAAFAHLFATSVDLHLAVNGDARFVDLAPITATYRVWELMGLASDPVKEYDLVLTATTAGSAGGNVAMHYWATK